MARRTGKKGERANACFYNSLRALILKRMWTTLNSRGGNPDVTKGFIELI